MLDYVAYAALQETPINWPFDLDLKMNKCIFKMLYAHCTQWICQIYLKERKRSYIRIRRGWSWTNIYVFSLVYMCCRVLHLALYNRDTPRWWTIILISGLLINSVFLELLKVLTFFFFFFARMCTKGSKSFSIDQAD